MSQNSVQHYSFEPKALAMYKRGDEHPEIRAKGAIRKVKDMFTKAFRYLSNCKYK